MSDPVKQGELQNQNGEVDASSKLPPSDGVDASGQPATGQPMVPGQQMMVPGQPMMVPGQPMMVPGQPMMVPGQQMMAPGQPMGQPMMAPGQPMGAPGQYAYYPNVPGQTPMVVGQQPGMPQAVQLMPAPQAIPGCPPGLEYMVQLDQLLVHQQIELAEMITNINFENKYMIKNSMGQQVYFAREQSDACMRICCGPARGFEMSITDNMGQEVIHISRIFKCCAGCCWCAASGNFCSFFVEVQSPPGTIIGYIRQTRSFASPHFDVQDADNQTQLKIRGHWCRCQTICCTSDIEFKIFTNDLKTQVGKVSKQWGGWLRESYTQADNFGVEFPTDLDVKTKALLLASTFLIDFMFFENKQQNKQNY
ncbi:phospholipid scramblase 2-like [Lytechinus pictus]|uniref:phospholipid scramblase 2-like n=1 Tax=Lytechinus pictus TaxID=7653 RepID=UPI0030B9C1AE